ncbi:hypothetical protein A0H81_02710 [Grifola frondosa]|uniref:Uncharacterized protein n=1 Tax=Grifola frondosa TaxID=5627 RepID=A0A1C7MP28_GRIFR|nr:hypothetical protein A0H81_02710 [Grifola frondosa]
MRVLHARAEPEKVSLAYRLLSRLHGFIGCPFAIALPYEEPSILARLEDVEPLVLVAVPVQCCARRVRLQPAEMHAELCKAGAIAEGELEAVCGGVDRVYTVSERCWLEGGRVDEIFGLAVRIGRQRHGGFRPADHGFPRYWTPKIHE